MPSISDISITIRAITKPYIKAIRGATTATMRFVSTLSRDLMSALFSIKGLIATVFAGAVFGRFIQGAVGAASSLEALNAQFKVLLGSQEEANKRMKELVKFSAQTPFQIQDIAQANKVLQSLTGGLLATAEGMKLVGDAAAFSDRPIREISVQIGRLFSGIQAGTAVGEPIARLRELGIISAKTGQQISDLLKQGMKGDQVWALAERELRKVTGTMEAMSKTTKGLWSTFKDNLNLVLAEFGKQLLPLVKTVLIEGINLLQKLQKGLGGLNGSFTKAIEIGVAFVKMLEMIGIAIAGIFPANELNNNFNAFQNNLMVVIGLVAFMANEFKNAKGNIKGDLADILLIAEVGFMSFFDNLKDNFGRLIDIWILDLRLLIGTAQEFFKIMNMSAKDLGKAFKEGDNPFELFAKNVKKLRKDLTTEMRDIERGAETLPETFERNFAELAKQTQDKFGGAITEALTFDANAFMKFKQEFDKFVKGRSDELRDAFSADIDLNIKDKGKMIDKLATVAKALKPTLALRGSQEAFRIGQDSDLMKKQLKANEQQVKEQKKTNNLLNNIGNMLGGAGGLNRAEPFNPNIQAGAGAGGLT